MRYRRKARWLLLRPAGPSSSRLGGCTAEIITIVIMMMMMMMMMGRMMMMIMLKDFFTKIHLCRSHTYTLTHRLETLQLDARATCSSKFLPHYPIPHPPTSLVGDGALQKSPPQRDGCEERSLRKSGRHSTGCLHSAKNSPKDGGSPSGPSAANSPFHLPSMAPNQPVWETRSAKEKTD